MSEPANDTPAGDGATLDGVLNGWGERTLREQLRWQFAAVNATLAGLQQLGEAQSELGRQVLQCLEPIQQQLQDADNLSDLTNVAAGLAQLDLDAWLRLGTKLTELGTGQWMQLGQEAGNGLVRLQSTYWESALNWFRLQTSFGGDSDMIEAEVEHVLSPLAASPLMWPAQEATRQATQLAANTWNDWLSWGGQFTDAGRALFGGNGAAKPH